MILCAKLGGSYLVRGGFCESEPRLASGESCRLVAGRSGLNIPRPGPPMGLPATEESDTEDAGRFLLVDAAGHENPIIRKSAVAWIGTLEGRVAGHWPVAPKPLPTLDSARMIYSASPP